MKKRIIAVVAVIAVIAVAAISLTGCNNVAAQRLLLNSRPWESVDVEEYFVYDVSYTPTEDSEVTGTYTVAVKGYDDDATLTIGDFSYDEPCYHVRSELRMDNGDYIVSDSVVTPDIHPVFGQEEKLDNGVLTSYTAKYADEDCTYTYSRTENGVEDSKSGTIGMGNFDTSAYIDNTFLYQLIRCLPDVATSLSFSVPNFIQSSKESARIAFSSTVVNEPFSNGAEVAEGEDAPTVACNAVTVTLSRTFPGSGTPLLCSVASGDYALDDGTKLAHMVVKIVEGATTYTLRTASSQIPTAD